MRTERHTTRLNPPDMKPLAELIAKLERVSVPMLATYRAGGGLFGQRQAICTISIPGSRRSKNGQP